MDSSGGGLVASKIADSLKADQASAAQTKTKDLLLSLIQPSQYVGEVYSLSYETALVQVHDKFRQDVGGIPSLSFLIATRQKGDAADHTREDCSVILLRVMDAASLPNATEAERIRVEVAQRASGEASHWDEPGMMDAYTANLLSFAGVRCRVIGTFYVDSKNSTAQDELILRFGSDISNYYPNQGLKVYKPNGDALKRIVNFRDPDRIESDPLGHHEVEVGSVRYASTNRGFQGISNVSVSIAPADLLDQKTALFGMTRTGKSNTTKIIAKAVFELRYKDPKTGKIGQLIFDPNGEYANENVQDGKNPTALKNVWKANAKGNKQDVVTYGLNKHPDDPDRKLMLINFFEERNLQIGKDIINAALEDLDAQYMKNFRDVSLEAPDPADKSATTRFQRRVLAYRTLLARAGFRCPASIKPATRSLFGADLIAAMQASPDADNAPVYSAAATVFQKPQPTWGELATAFEALHRYIKEARTSGYQTFNAQYIQRSSSGSTWADSPFEKMLEMFNYANGVRALGRLLNQHTPDTSTDYADDVYKELCDGKLVIIDQSSGDPVVNQSSARRIMTKIFGSNQEAFRNAKVPPRILLYVEEAHNILPTGTDTDLHDVWVRTAKEGSKLKLGFVYATQEVSSIQKNILKNTSNWFIGHLNNTDETKELCKYYDFADFEPSIRRTQDRGFLRVKTLSNLYVVPVQVRKFEV